MTFEEKEEYIKLNKKVYEIKVDDTLFYFRTLESIKYLCAFFTTSPIYNTTFKIYSNIEIIKYNYADLFGDSYSDIEPLFKAFTYRFNDRYEDFYHHKYFKNYIELEKVKSKSDLLFSVIENTSLFKKNSYVEEINFDSPKDFLSKFLNRTLKFTKKINLSDLEKINEFKLDKINIEEFLQNRNKYMNDEPLKKINNKK